MVPILAGDACSSHARFKHLSAEHAAVIPFTCGKGQNRHMTELESIREKIDSLDDEHAILVLRLVAEYDQMTVSADDWASAQNHISEAVAASGLDRYTPPPNTSYSDGDLARAALHYHAESGKDSADVIDQAIAYASEPRERFGLETLALGALVLAVLQTDVKLSNKNGRWSFEVHKKAMSDSALAKVITAFIGHFVNPGK